jgi:DNA-directed RNA polymerase II subunit RPB2
MPFSENGGMVPDVLVNPHVLPGRMTVSWLVEMFTGRVDGMSGTRSDASAHRPASENVDMFIDQLREMGYNTEGTETFIDGRTGELLEIELFAGPSYFTQLKHMIMDKFQSRGPHGARDVVTGEAVKGRSKIGGSAIRFGGMEGDASLAHGAAAFVTERLRDAGGSYHAVFCIDCGYLVSYRLTPATYVCNYCHGNNFGQTIIPFSFKYITQILTAGNMLLRCYFGENKLDDKGLSYLEELDEPEIHDEESSDKDDDENLGFYEDDDEFYEDEDDYETAE